jgi:hypothetical protein
MELAMHWHRCSNLSERCMRTSGVYRETDHPVKDEVANEPGLGGMLYLTTATKQSCPYCVLSVLVFDTVRCDGKSGLSDCSTRRCKPWSEPAVPPAVPYVDLRQGNAP